jgi:hypothetical protein
MSNKIYCFVDESGQDTQGKLFLVAIVVTDDNIDKYRDLCQSVERSSHKGKTKWADSKFDCRMSYIANILHIPDFRGRLFYSSFLNTKHYQDATIKAIIQVLQNLSDPISKATVYIDALPRSLEQSVILGLRRAGLHIAKVRGIAKDENEALIRLADALCGFARGAIDGNQDLQEMLDWGIKTGVIHDLTD